MPEKKRTTIEIESEIYERIKDELLWSRQSMKSLVNNTLEWVLNQPEEVQSAIVAGMPSSLRPEFAKMLLEKMAEEEDDLPEPLQLPKTQPPLRSAARKKPKRSK